MMMIIIIQWVFQRTSLTINYTGSTKHKNNTNTKTEILINNKLILNVVGFTSYNLKSLFQK
jgi:hypothetical protein